VLLLLQLLLLLLQGLQDLNLLLPLVLPLLALLAAACQQVPCQAPASDPSCARETATVRVDMWMCLAHALLQAHAAVVTPTAVTLSSADLLLMRR
jgi:hypothetical protein